MMCWHLRELHICSKWKGLGSENLVSQKVYPTETYIESKNNVLTFSIRTEMDWSQEASMRSWLGSALHEHGFSCDSVVNNPPANAGDLGLVLGLGRSPGEGKGYPVQYSGPENSMDHIVHGIAKSWTWVRNFHFTSVPPEPPEKPKIYLY